ncbi:hypothetical protein FQN54_009171 [Arachnomyces sp. PD_36]|nr:hypothetical protein FQN54_009171 [Arachnomyces sp. PD_36]
MSTTSTSVSAVPYCQGTSLNTENPISPVSQSPLPSEPSSDCENSDGTSDSGSFDSDFELDRAMSICCSSTPRNEIMELEDDVEFSCSGSLTPASGVWSLGSVTYAEGPYMRGGTTPLNEFAAACVPNGIGVDAEAVAEALRRLMAINEAVYNGTLALRVVDP